MSEQVPPKATGSAWTKRLASLAGCAMLVILIGCSREPSASSPRSVLPQQPSAALEPRYAGLEDVPPWTPEMHAAARALVDQEFPNGRVAIEAAMRGSHRSPGAADRDRFRHPAETLSFFGFAPTMTVLDIGPGAGQVLAPSGELGLVLGYYTELLAPALAKHGRYIATNREPPRTPPAPASHHWTEYEGVRFDALLRAAPELYGKVQVARVDYDAPKLNLDDGTVDLVLLMREVHMMQNRGTLDAWLREIRRVLEPNGVLGVEEHRAAPGTDPAGCCQTGYVPEAWVIAKIESAGFALAGKSEINANPRDTKDHPDGVWSLPPTFMVGPAYAPSSAPDAKYAAIGESDRMTLKFVKVAGGIAP